MRKIALLTSMLLAALGVAAPGAAQTRDACLDAARALTGAQARWEDSRGSDYRRDGFARWRSADGSYGSCRIDDRGAVYEVRVETWGRGPFSGSRPGTTYPGTGSYPGGAGGRYGLTEEFGYDRRGADYTSVATRVLSACQAACRDDARCVAYTFGAQEGRCWLKSRVTEAQASRDMVTGYKLEDVGGGGGSWGRLTEEWDLDRRGNDFDTFRADGLAQCKQQCLDENRCRAYTFDSRTRTCYLKDRVNAPQRNDGMVTGYKQ